MDAKSRSHWHTLWNYGNRLIGATVIVHTGPLLSECGKLVAFEPLHGGYGVVLDIVYEEIAKDGITYERHHHYPGSSTHRIAVEDVFALARQGSGLDRDTGYILTTFHNKVFNILPLEEESHTD